MESFLQIQPSSSLKKTENKIQFFRTSILDPPYKHNSPLKHEHNSPWKTRIVKNIGCRTPSICKVNLLLPLSHTSVLLAFYLCSIQRMLDNILLFQCMQQRCQTYRKQTQGHLILISVISLRSLYLLVH